MKSSKLVSTIRIFFILLFLVFMLEPGFADLGWYDPDPAATPMPYDDFISPYPTNEASWTVMPTEEDGFTREDVKSDPKDKTIMIVVEEAVFSNAGDNVQSSLLDYIDYLMKDYSKVTTILWENGFPEPDELRTVIANVYFGTEHYEKLAGCIFIGNLPSAWFTFDSDIPNVRPPKSTTAEFPTDLFFMDLDGSWIDSGPITDGLYDVHQGGSGDKRPEIWVSRICPTGADLSIRIALINEYFTKNMGHRDKIENWDLIDNFGARCYADIEPNFMENDINGKLEEIYTESRVVLHNNDAVTSSSDYENTIGPSVNLYEFLHIGCTSSAYNHTFGIIDTNDPDSNTGSVDTTGIANIVGKKGIFYNIVGSSAARFIEDDYIGNSYLFGPNTDGLVVLGSTKNGGMQDTKNFYTDFKNDPGPGNDSTVGECFRSWVNQYLADEIPEKEQQFCYGMTIIGDGTLKRCFDPATQAIEKGVNQLSDYLENIDSQPATFVYGAHKPATAGLAVLALLNWDIPESDPDVTAGINYLLGNLSGSDGDPVRYITGDRNATYNTACAILALTAAHNDAYNDELAAMRAYLMDIQNGNGGFGYGHSGSYTTRSDNSNTQFAVMGINIATWALYRDLTDDAEIQAQKEIPRNAYLESLAWLAAIHDGNGGYGYRSIGSTSTMTAAAVWNYCLAIDGLKHTGMDLSLAEQRRENALGWLLNHNPYNLNGHGRYGYYYAFTLAKALRMSGEVAYFPNWYDYLANQIVPLQSDNGLWPPFDNLPTHIETGFAVAALQVDKTNPDTVAAEAFILNSHANLHVYDSRGNHTGYNSEYNKVEETIPGSRYLIRDKWYEEYVTYDFFRQQEDDQIPHPTDPTLDPYERFEQEIIIFNPMPDTYRIEIEGTSAGDYELTIETQKEGELLEDVSYTGEIKEIVIDGETTYSVHATYETVANIAGGVPITAPKPDVSPRIGLDKNSVICRAPRAPQNNDTAEFTFTISETGMEKTLEVDKIKFIGIFSDIDVSDFIYPEQIFVKNADDDELFTHASITHETPKEILVEIPVPRGFEGPSTASLQIISNGGIKYIEVTIQTNRPPIPDAGEDQVVYAGAEGTPDAWVTLDASGSTDPDGDELSFKWFEGEKLLSTDMIFDYRYSVGVHTITLKVSDGNEEAEDEVVITVVEPEPGDLWISPSIIRRYSKARWVRTILTPSGDITFDDIDMDFKVTLNTQAGESIEAVKQYVVSRRSGMPEGNTKCNYNRKRLTIVAYFSRKALLEAVPDDGVVKLTEVCKLKNEQYINGVTTVLIKTKADKLGYLKIFPFYIERSTEVGSLTSFLVLPRWTSSEDIDPEAMASLILPNGEILKPESQTIYPPQSKSGLGYPRHSRRKKKIISSFSMQDFLEKVPDDGVIQIFVQYDLANGKSIYGIANVTVYTKK